MNVLIDGVTPKVASLKEVLRAFLAHRREVLERRSRHRVEKIEHRLEVLEGFITAFLNLDRVIDIIRYDDDPKAALMREDWSKDHVRATDEKDYKTPSHRARASLSEIQVDAILNMRLRSFAASGRTGTEARARRIAGRMGRPSGPVWKTKVASGRPSPISCGT